jgi:hypothetical protein
MVNRRYLLVLAALVLAACAKTPHEGPPINWDAPFGSAAPSYPNADSADKALPFKVVVPAWGTPDLIQTIPEAALAGPSDQVVALVYHLKNEGTVNVEESLPGSWSLDRMIQTASDHAGFQMVPLRRTQGMLVEGNGVGRIMWIENGLMFDITGPSVTTDQVLALAEKL